MSSTNGSWIKRAGLFSLVIFYVAAGVNHFVMPNFYYPLIPDYLGEKVLLNQLSGIAELILGIGLLLNFTRRVAVLLLILMLLAFIPAHIHFIQLGGCVSDSLCVALWIAWVRLIVIHPLLIAWAFYYRNYHYA